MDTSQGKTRAFFGKSSPGACSGGVSGSSHGECLGGTIGTDDKPKYRIGYYSAP